MTIHFCQDDWAGIRENYAAWWAGKLDRALLYLAGVTEDGGPATWSDWGHFMTDYPDDVPPAQIVRQYVAEQSNRRFLGDTFPSFFVNFGPGVVSAMLGAALKSAPDTVWFEAIPGATVGNLKIAFDRGRWWQRVKSITQTAVEITGGLSQIKHTDMGGITDILASLVGTQELLFDLLDNPEKVTAQISAVRQAWFQVYDELSAIIQPICPGTMPWAPTWAPGQTYILQSDFSYMISPEMFARFVRPDLVACCERIEYPFYHLDGVGELPHVDHLLSIPKLRGIQWIPGAGKPPATEWLDLLGRIRAGGKLQQIFADCDGIRAVCRALGGQGFQFACYDPMTPSQAKAFIEEVQSLS